MRKVIFLDIDGVLNTEQQHRRFYTEQTNPIDEYGLLFDPDAVASLTKIIDQTGADIVISSSWKFWGLSRMRQMWEDRKLPGKIIGITPDTVSDEMLLTANLDEMENFALRGSEIKEWLSMHGKKVSQYAIIDDVDSFLPEQRPYYVEVSPITGITEEDAERVIKILTP